jgi:hypothetical protein
MPHPTSQVREQDIVLTSAEPSAGATRAATSPALDDFDRKLAELDARGATGAYSPWQTDTSWQGD